MLQNLNSSYHYLFTEIPLNVFKRFRLRVVHIVSERSIYRRRPRKQCRRRNIDAAAAAASV